MKQRLVLPIILLLMLSMSVIADQGVEPVTVRVTNYDAATRTYGFSCKIPEGVDPLRYWTIRPDTTGLETSFFTTTPNINYTLSKDVLYHIGCQVYDGNAYVRGDFHIDRRTGPNQLPKSNIVTLSTNGLQATLKCDAQSNDPTWQTYDIEWHQINASHDIELSQLHGQSQITASVGSAGLWDYACTIKQKSTVNYTERYPQWGLPIEFFPSGPAYLPTIDGCIPGAACPWANQSNSSSTPQQPISFTSTAPQNTIAINTSQTQQFSFTLNNASLLKVASWTINGANASSAFNQSVLSFLTPTAGSYTIVATATGSNTISNTWTVTVSAPQAQATNQSSTCYGSVKDIPATCSGGTITTDSYNGCRTVTCTTSGSSLQILACDKSGFFEIYRQTQTGNAISDICMGNTCIGNSGYAKSASFPICISTNTTPTSNTTTPANTTPTNSTNTTPNTTPGTNTKPNKPEWLEPGMNKTNVDPYDFHINVFDMVDTDGDKHIASDFEIWDVALNQRVWSSTKEDVFILHIHNPDGIFENDRAGQDRLRNNRTYQVRARFYTNSTTNNVSDWSDWRVFRTRPVYEFNASPFLWTAKDGYTVDLVAANISMPTNLKTAPNIYQNLPEGQRPLLYVTQLYGQIGMIRRDGTYIKYADNLLNYDSFGVFPGQGETGVTGLYVDQVTGDVYASMVYCILANCNNPDVTLTPNGLRGKVVKFTTDRTNGATYTAMTTIIDNITTGPSHQIQSITRGPDGKIYVTTGDALTRQFDAKNPGESVGKVLRMNDDGTVPADNPYPTAAFPKNYVYASGFRNPFGSAWRPSYNQLWVSDNGADENDSVKRVEYNKTYGWCCNGAEGAFHFWPNSVAPTAMTFDDGTNGFPSTSAGTMYQSLAGATYSKGPNPEGKRIVQFFFNPDGSKNSVETLVQYTGPGYGAPIGIDFGDEGLYFTDLYGEAGFVGIGKTKGNIYLVHQGNQTASLPPAGFSVGIGPKAWYPQGLNMIWQCNAIGGSGAYTYSYTFGDGQQQLNAGADTFHTYPANGTYTATCTATDTANGQSLTATTSITIGTVAPAQLQNISFASLSPSANAVAISEPNSQTFSYTLSNPSSIQTTSTWTLNGQQVGTGTSYLFSGNFSAAGSYTIDLLVSSAQNSLSRTWTLNVTDTPTGGGGAGQSNTCYTSVKDIPATCTGGTITTDSYNGCRMIICASPGKNLQIMACDKSGFFEMYKQSATGSVEICIGSTCMSNAGYAKSANFPICVGNATNVNTTAPNTTNTTVPNTTQPSNLSVSLGIAQWYPKGRDYIFVCTANGFTPTSYEFSFGDGNTNTRTSNDVYYTYAASGSYQATCTAKNAVTTKTGTLSVVVA